MKSVLAFLAGGFVSGIFFTLVIKPIAYRDNKVAGLPSYNGLYLAR